MTQFTVPALQLRIALGTALAFADQDEDYPHPVLGGVHVAPEGDTMAITATNRYIASYETLKAEGEIFPFTITGDVARDVIGLIPVPDPDSEYPAREPRMVSFVDTGDGKVTVRIVGPDTTATITFKAPDAAFPDITKVFATAEQNTESPAAGIHLAPNQLVNVVTAINERQSIEPLRIDSAGAEKPMVVSQGDNFKALIMAVKVNP